MRIHAYKTEEDLHYHCPVISIRYVSDYGFFNVFAGTDVKGLRLYEIVEISDVSRPSVSLKGVKFDKVHPWVDIPMSNLNFNSGKHSYKMSFVSEDDDMRYSTCYFFNYISQDDNPPKKYIYMEDRDVEDYVNRDGKYI